MKLVRFFVSALLIGAVISFTACSDDEDDVVNSSKDEPSTEEPGTEEPGDEDEPEEDDDATVYGEGVHFVNGGSTVYFYDYGETIEIGLASTESWTATADAEWVTVETASGEASDKIQYLSVTAARNYESNTRDCTLTVTGETDEISLTLSQDPQNIKVEFVERVGHLDCYFGYAYYSFSYSGVGPGDEITVSGTVTGKDDISLPTVTVIATDRKGIVNIPFQVGPKDFDFTANDDTPLTTPGTVSTTASVSILDVDRCDYQATETVYVMVYDCAKFTLGGDYVGQKEGVMAEGFSEPIFPNNGEGEWVTYPWDSDYETVTCPAGFCAFTSIIDYFENVHTAFNMNRGGKATTTTSAQWYGTQDHAFYRQLAIGSDESRTGVGYGSFITPILYKYMGSPSLPCTLKVTLDICPAVGRTDWPTGSISTRGGSGTRDSHTFSSFSNLATPASEDELHWETISYTTTIESETEFIRIQSSGDSSSDYSTIFITNYLIELE